MRQFAAGVVFGTIRLTLTGASNGFLATKLKWAAGEKWEPQKAKHSPQNGLNPHKNVHGFGLIES